MSGPPDHDVDELFDAYRDMHPSDDESPGRDGRRRRDTDRGEQAAARFLFDRRYPIGGGGFDV